MRQSALLLSFALALAGCTTLSPFATYPQAAQKAGLAGPRVAICYNPLASSASEVKKEAQEKCPAKRVAVRVATDWHLNYCPVLLPYRATFACAAT